MVFSSILRFFFDGVPILRRVGCRCGLSIRLCPLAVGQASVPPGVLAAPGCGPSAGVIVSGFQLYISGAFAKDIIIGGGQGFLYLDLRCSFRHQSHTITVKPPLK